MDGQSRDTPLQATSTDPRNPPAAPRQCILVLGMHRSGTSALTRVLSLMGATLPKNILGANESNEKGHWEPARLIEYHDQFLAELGSSWDDWRPLGLDGLPGTRRNQVLSDIQRILAIEYDDSPLIVLKEPRICRFAPLFLEALDEAGFETRVILPIRNPLEVAASLEKRTGLWSAERSRTYAILLWLRHVLDAEAATRNRPRAFVSYNDLLNDWRSTLEALTRRLAITWPKTGDEIAPSVQSFLSIDDRRNRSSVDEVLLNPDFRHWTASAFEALLSLEQDSTRQDSLTCLDRIRSELDHATPIIARLYEDFKARHHSLLAEHEKSDADRRALGAALALNEAEVSRLLAEKAEVEARAAEAQMQQAAETHRFKVALDMREAELARHLADKEQAEIRAAESLKQQDAERQHHKDSVNRHEAEIARLLAQKIEAEGRAVETQKELEEERELRNSVTGKLEAEITRLIERQREAESAAAEANRQHMLSRAELSRFGRLGLRTTIRRAVEARDKILGIPINLTPQNELILNSDENGVRAWSMTGSDPQFILDRGTDAPFTPGRYILFCRSDTSSFDRPELYIDSGLGYNATEVIPLNPKPYGHDGWSVTFSLPKGALSLRLDPSCTPGHITISKVKLLKLSRTSYYYDLSKYVFQDHPKAVLKRSRQIFLKGLSIFLESGYKGLTARLREYEEARRQSIATTNTASIAKAFLGDKPRGPSMADRIVEKNLKPHYDRTPEWSATDRPPPAIIERHYGPNKIVFVANGTIISNSGGHVKNFAEQLSHQGNMVYVVAKNAKVECIQGVNYIGRDVVLDRHNDNHEIWRRFDGRTIIHTWTPRTDCIELTHLLAERLLAPYVVHMEDNEDLLTAEHLGLNPSQFLQQPALAFNDTPTSLSHPLNFRTFIASSIGVTVIVDKLAEFVPDNVPVCLLEPGVNTRKFMPFPGRTHRTRLLHSFRVPDNATIFAYNGNMHPANKREIFSLYTALLILRRRNHNVHLLRTGTDYCNGIDLSFGKLKGAAIELGFVEEERMLEILQCADFFVQPGRGNAFNDYRFPSKLPEFLSLGRPVLLPRSNLGRRLVHKEEAIIMERGDGVEIADCAELIMADAALREKIGKAGRRFAESNLDWGRNARGLNHFYNFILDRN